MLIQVWTRFLAMSPSFMVGLHAEAINDEVKMGLLAGQSRFKSDYDLHLQMETISGRDLFKGVLPDSKEISCSKGTFPCQLSGAWSG